MTDPKKHLERYPRGVQDMDALNQAYAKWQSGPVTPRTAFDTFAAGWNASATNSLPLIEALANVVKIMEQTLAEYKITLDK